MNDRELLELAAKAAGVDKYVWSPVAQQHDDDWAGSTPIVWNPLADDGDALRLAVKLRIDIIHYQSGVLAELIGNDDCHEENGTDPSAATRRAIVRAAAEIGKLSPPEDVGQR